MARRNLLVILLLCVAVTGCAVRPAENSARPDGAPQGAAPLGPGKNRDWTVSTPEAQGMDAALLEQMLAAVEDRGLRLDSLLVIRGGSIVLEQYYGSQKAGSLHEMYSVTKSFTAALLAAAYDRGKFEGVDARVVDVLDGRQFAALDERKAAMTVEDLLTMSAGLDWQESDPAYNAMYRSRDWVQTVMDLPMTGDPGEAFNYCSGCSHVISAIVRQSMGGSEAEFARDALFAPLGITHYRWEEDPQGNLIGGWGLWLNARDMARFGYLFLNNGVWEGKQVILPGWVEASVTKHQAGDGRLDYGYHWWVARKNGAFAALGRGGQMIYVDPSLDLIMVTTANMSGSHDPLLDLIDEFVEPSVQEIQPVLLVPPVR